MKCPICAKPVELKDNPHRPFCSERCKLIDFGAWVNEEYGVPSDAPPSLDELDRLPSGTSSDGDHDRTLNS